MNETAHSVGEPQTSVDSISSASFIAPKPDVRRGWLHRGSAPAAAALPAPRRRSVNRRRGQFSLLIVRGDGVRVVRFNFARPAAVAGVVALAASVSIVGALLGDWFKLRQ